jgi:hypothetical protein
MTTYYKQVSKIVIDRGGLVGPLQLWCVIDDKIAWWHPSLGEQPTNEEIESVELSETNIEAFTAEDWVSKYFTNLEVIAMMRLEQAILSQGKTLGPKMEASKQWLEAMMFAQPSNAFLPAPYTYTEASAEAALTLFI